MNPSAPRARSLRSRLIKPVMVALALYILGAYLLAPALWRRHERADLAHHDFLTRTTAGIPGDPINVALTGKVPQLLRAMQAAGWSPADPITLRSSVEIGLSVLLDRPYRDAPVSTLLYDGRRQDLAFERLVGGSADRRHHVRFWRMAGDGDDLFLGAASFDRGVGISHLTGQITHHIAPDIDTERDGLMQALAEAGAVTNRMFVPGSGPTLTGEMAAAIPMSPMATFFSRPSWMVRVHKPSPSPPPTRGGWACAAGRGASWRASLAVFSSVYLSLEASRSSMAMALPSAGRGGSARPLPVTISRSSRREGGAGFAPPSSRGTGAVWSGSSMGGLLAVARSTGQGSPRFRQEGVQPSCFSTSPAR